MGYVICEPLLKMEMKMLMQLLSLMLFIHHPSLCGARAARVRDRETKPRCRYKDCGMEIRDTPYVVNRKLDKPAERAKILKNTSKDEFGGDSGVEVSSVASSCSIDSMGRPPDRRPAVISELFSSKTAETCDVRKKHVSSEKKCAVSVRKTAQTCNVRKKYGSSGKKSGVSVRKTAQTCHVRKKYGSSEKKSGVSVGKTAQTCHVRKKYGSSGKKSGVSVGKTDQTCNVRKKHVSSGKKCAVSVPKTAETCDVRKKYVSSGKKSGVSVRKTAQTCDVRKKHVSSGKKCAVSVRKPNEPFAKENTEARGSVPVSSSSSDRDTRCKETPSGDPGSDLMSIPNKCRSIRYPAVQGKLKTKSDFSKDLSGVDSNSSLDELDGDSGIEGSSVGSSCSIASVDPPPNMSPDRISDVELFSSKTASWDVYSVGDSGGEEFKHPIPGRTTRYHGCLSRSLSFPYNINIEPFGEKPGSDQWVFPEQMSSVLYPERWHSMSSLRTGIEFQGV